MDLSKVYNRFDDLNEFVGCIISFMSNLWIKK